MWGLETHFTGDKKQGSPLASKRLTIWFSKTRNLIPLGSTSANLCADCWDSYFGNSVCKIKK